MNYIYNIIEQAIRSFEISVEVSQTTTENDVYMVIRQVMRDNPDIFWFSHQWRFAQNEHKVYFSYTISKKRAEETKKQIADVIEKDFCIEEVHKLTPVEQVMYIYKWLALYCDYNVYSAYNQTIYSVFVYRNSVCTGYAKAAQYLFELLGIESKLVFGKIKNSEKDSRHCWLVVNIDGTWYHLDPTFAVSSIQHMLRNAGVEPVEGVDGLIYNYFCTDDATVKLSKEPSARSKELIEDEDALPKCNSCIDYSTLQYLKVKLHRTDNVEPMGCRGHLIASNGTTADIYAWHSDADKKTVAKVFRDDENHTLLNHELRIRREIGFSAHFINVYGVTNDQNGLIIEQATPLADLLCSHYYQLTTHGLCKLLVDIIDALQECINHRIYYRDIHLNNIYRTDKGTYKLGDFGSCIWVDRENPNIPAGIGSPWYMTPETYKNGIFDDTSAVYGVAMIAYYLLNELYPPLWHEYGKQSLSLRMNNSQEIPLPLRLQKDSTAFGKDFGRILLIALQHNPYLRQQSLSVLRNEIMDACSKTNNAVLLEGGSSERIHKEDSLDSTVIVGSSKNEHTTFESTCIPNPDILVSNGDDEPFIIVDTDDFLVENTQIDVDNSSACIVDVYYDGAIDYDISSERIDDFACTAGGFGGSDYVSSIDDPFDSQETSAIPNRTRDWIDDFATSAALPRGCSSECKQTFTPQQKPSESASSSLWSRLFGKKEKRQDVYSSVFAPSEVKPKSRMMVQVYLHLNEETEKVRELATETDKNAERRDYIPLQTKLKKGDTIDVVLNINGDRLLYDGRKSIIWQGSFCKCAFDYLVPSALDVDELSSLVTLYVNGAIVGEMLFYTQIVNSPAQLNANVIAKPAKKLFISYSHNDLKSAEKIAKIHEALGIEVFFDKHRLKSGYIYSEEIFNFIRTADTFVLCWSENAAQSEYVQKERKAALELAYPNCRPREDAQISIKPYNIQPYAIPPKDMIEHYHFEEL